MIIDRLHEDREKRKFFREYRLRWYKVFGKMTKKQEDLIWKMYTQAFNLQG